MRWLAGAVGKWRAHRGDVNVLAGGRAWPTCRQFEHGSWRVVPAAVSIAMESSLGRIGIARRSSVDRDRIGMWIKHGRWPSTASTSTLTPVRHEGRSHIVCLGLQKCLASTRLHCWHARRCAVGSGAIRIPRLASRRLAVMTSKRRLLRWRWAGHECVCVVGHWSGHKLPLVTPTATRRWGGQRLLPMEGWHRCRIVETSLSECRRVQ